jgi:predicted restriction endonuclease
MGGSQGGGKTIEVAPQPNETEHILDIEGLKKKVREENRRWSDKKPDGTKKVRDKNSDDRMTIRDFLYAQYNGHCQICGDTFIGNKDCNIFIKFPLNKSKKGDKLKSDVNRKGNSLSLCPKHDKMLDLGLQTFSFTKDLDSAVSLDIDTIEKAFGPAVDVGKDYIVEENDGFYNSPEEETPFEVKAFRLPIKLFKRKFYIKFTEEHILHFIEVWKSN